MNTNYPNQASSVFIGLTPFSIAYALMKNNFEKCRFVDLVGDSYPGQSRFWSSIEIDLLKLNFNKLDVHEYHRPIELRLRNKRFIFGQDTEANFHELVRKFNFFKLDGIHNRYFQYLQNVEADFYEIWLSIIKNGSADTVNFTQIFRDLKNPIIKDLYVNIDSRLLADDEGEVRELISSLSVLFFGFKLTTFRPLQIFYLVTKILCPNYYFDHFSHLVGLFELNSNFVFPRSLNSENLNITEYKTTDGQVKCVELDGYDGRLFTQQIFSSGITCRYNIQSADEIFPVVGHRHKLSISEGINYDYLIVNCENLLEKFSLQFGEELEVYQFNFDGSNNYSQHFGQFFILSSHCRKIFKKGFESREDIGELFDSYSMIHVKNDLLHKSFTLGNISALFYGQ